MIRCQSREEINRAQISSDWPEYSDLNFNTVLLLSDMGPLNVGQAGLFQTQLKQGHASDIIGLVIA
jgi:hypothetical protein